MTVALYEPAMIYLLIFTLIVMFQSALVGAAKAKAGMPPGGEPEQDYESRVYRLHRSHQNGLEILPPAFVALVAAIATGVSPFWVNLAMGIFLLTRIAFVWIYAAKVGRPIQGMRTISFVSGWTMLVLLCLAALWRLF